MFSKRFHLFTLFGFDIKLDASWFVLGFLVTWSLATGFFPITIPRQSAVTYWILGAAGALGLFASIVLHETSHAVVARQNDIPMRGITLFIFGGVAEMEREPPSARAEFLMAGAGPLASIVIGIVCFAAGFLLPLPMPVAAVIGYLATINIVLAIFNLIPAFPLDGGRILRAALWHKWSSLERATRVSSMVGSGFGLLLIGGGVLLFIQREFIGGMWMALIGMFVRNAAAASYQQMLVGRALGGEPVRAFARADPVTVPAEMPVRSLVEDVIYRHHFKMYPVVQDGHLTGYVESTDAARVGREDWDRVRVGEIAHPSTAANTVHPDLSARDALRVMRRSGQSRLLVAEDGRLVGIVAMKDMLDFLTFKLELEQRSS